MFLLHSLCLIFSVKPIKRALYGVLLVAISSPVCSDPYGTLFTTAGQRAKLDGRSADAEYKQPISGQHEGKDNSVTPIRLNGTLLSSGGKKEVWLDGRPQLSSTSPERRRVRLLRTDQVQIKTSSESISHAMKPGQVLDPETGVVSEYYQQDGNLKHHRDD